MCCFVNIFSSMNKNIICGLEICEYLDFIWPRADINQDINKQSFCFTFNVGILGQWYILILIFQLFFADSSNPTWIRRPCLSIMFKSDEKILSYECAYSIAYTGEKPFKCLYCEYRTSTKSNLKTHMNYKHCHSTSTN